ncbi:hypothetical protein H310_00882 [Aphanomyces invadans]|uniref:Uncharacterized protein n=1 Tax=Aphanomyces invadans TaxID=157072 RepID=A0A024UPM0_9STRA|nr:hypothetical protein H310_00882 [Aphanomyces invadans]ETW08244.1 hypothetical protein H310_00882 [Aphanomyces invadans]|eukprot:XP_008862049.1 hypothetical protein H310_00882 [Aphanomyces invadans]
MAEATVGRSTDGGGRPASADQEAIDGPRHRNAFDELPSEAKDHAVRGVQLLKQGDFLAGIEALEAAIEVEGDCWILWKHVAIAHYDLWRHVASAKATLASTWFLAEHSGGAADPLERFLRTAYDVFVVAMEYKENKNHPAMLLKLAVLYVELDAWQGALELCTLVLETTKWSNFHQFNEAVFLSGVVALGLRHATQSGEYFAYLIDNPPHNLRSYQVLLLAGMQFDSQTDSPEAIERCRVLYVEAYKRLTTGVRIVAPAPSEATAMEIYLTSRKSESERIQMWLGDANVWETLGMDLFTHNHPFLAARTFDYALQRQGCRSVENLVTVGRVHHRLKRVEKAQMYFEQALSLSYYAHPTRYWLGVVSFPWSQHFKKEDRGARTYQRLYRGYRARCRVLLLRHRRACTWLEKMRCASYALILGRAAKHRVAVRKAAELEREAAARADMHVEDWFLVYLKWHAAARLIQSLLPISRAKKEKITRRAWLQKHKALLRRVVSHTNDRLVQTCFSAMVEFVEIVHDEQLHAALVLQRAARKWLGRRHLARLAAKNSAQQKLLVVFLGKAKKRWKADCFFAWRTCRERTIALRRASAIRIQCAFRSYKARQVLRANMARQVRVRQFMAQLVISRDGLCLRKSFRAMTAFAFAARLHKHACATRIQKILRGRLARKLVVRVRKRHQHCEGLVAKALAQRAEKFLAQLWTSWVLFGQVVQLERQLAAIRIQRMERGRAARRRVKTRREYLFVYFDHDCLPRGGSTQLRLAFVGLWKHRRYRTDREDAAARTIQRAVKRRRHQLQAQILRNKLKRKMQVATIFQKTFHAAATAFFHVLKGLCTDKRQKLDAAARTLQRNLRGWLARRVMARLAQQYHAAKSLLDRVIHRESRAAMAMVMRLWKAGILVCRDEKNAACVAIQRRYRARRATREARLKMDKRRRQRQLIEQGTGKPLARCFRTWQRRVIEAATATFNASLSAKYAKHLGAWSPNALTGRAGDLLSAGVPSMLFYHVLTRTRSSGLCQLPPCHGFDRAQLRQLLELASSVISDSRHATTTGGHPRRGSNVVETIAWMPECPVQKLILYNEPSIDGTRLAVCLDQPKTHPLVSVVLGGSFLPSRHIMAVALSLAQPHSKLQQLVLESCRLGNTGAAVLALGLAHNKSVWKLDLSGNNIGDIACQALGEMLLANDTLEILSLNQNDVSDNAVLGYLEPVLLSLPAASAVVSIQLRGNGKLTSRGLDALQSAAAFVNQNAMRPSSKPLAIDG